MLQPIARDVWGIEFEIRYPGGFRMPVRGTIVRLPDGGLWVHSPPRVADDVYAEVAKLGEVRHLVAPCLIHHMYVRRWHERFPSARLHHAPGLEKKRADLPWTDALGDAAPPAWAGAIDQVFIGGAPKLGETVFFHRPSGTLIVSDFVFNLTHPANVMSSLVLRMMGVHGRVAQSRAWRVAVRGASDRAAAAASARRVLAWPFDRLVPAHGAVVDTGAHGEVERALAWMTSV